MVILITGKAGAGKSTYAARLALELEHHQGVDVVLIDSENARTMTKNDDFSDEGRLRNLTHIASEAKKHEDQGYIVLIAAIAPKKEWRDLMRVSWKQSRIVYMPGGSLWSGTTYEFPTEEEF